MFHQAGNSASRQYATSMDRDQSDHIQLMNAGPSSPTLSALGASANSGQSGASSQQAASSLPVSSIPGSTGSPRLSFGALPRSRAAAHRPHGSPLNLRHTPQRGRRHNLPATSGATGAHSDAMSDDAGVDQIETFLYGTTLKIGDVQTRIQKFMRCFVQEGSNDALYATLVKEALDAKQSCLNLDLVHLLGYDKELYSQLVLYPGEVVPLLDAEAGYIAEDVLGPELREWMLLTVRPFNLKEHKVIRDLNPEDMNQLISVSGMVTRTGGIIPDLRCAVFRCAACGEEAHRHTNGNIIDDPIKCPRTSCGKSFTMQLMPNWGEYTDKQLVKMQESPNAIPEGETSHSVTLFVHDQLLDVAKPGDRITVTGIYKAESMPVAGCPHELKSVFKTHIDVMHISKDERNHLTSQRGTESKEQVECNEAEMQALGADPNVYDNLVASVAPSIWQMDDVKKGILCQLFGGTNKEISGGQTRSDINVLLVGDPSTCKSQLLSYVHKLAPRGLYTSGRGSTGVGLTASVTKDPETQQLVLNGGALVLSDQGVCCIDEFDKMSHDARSMLHEVMEHQTVSVAKAGIIANMNARTSVLACANPVGSRYNPRMSVIDNIHMPPSLLSRFDLIYLVLDKVNVSTDRKLGRHLIALFHENSPDNTKAVIPFEKLRDFIAYARSRCQPDLSDAAGKDLVLAYKAMRQQGAGRKTISATPRQLESMVRLSEALARMRLSPVVERHDAAEAVRLVKVALQQSATDPYTGQVDMDCITTGMSSSCQEAQKQLANQLEKLLKEGSAPMTLGELVSKINEQASIPVSMQAACEAIGSISHKVTRLSSGQMQHESSIFE